jgi:D-lactate dehydrogenase (cytochrome)
MARRGVKVTIAGARTGLVGGCVPNEGALVSLENFDRMLALYYDVPSAEWRLKAQCAVNLRTIAAQLAVKSIPDIERCADGMTLIEMDRFRQDPDFYFYPPDPTEMSASLGGTVAPNASGARTFRHGRPATGCAASASCWPPASCWTCPGGNISPPRPANSS